MWYFLRAILLLYWKPSSWHAALLITLLPMLITFNEGMPTEQEEQRNEISIIFGDAMFHGQIMMPWRLLARRYKSVSVSSKISSTSHFSRRTIIKAHKANTGKMPSRHPDTAEIPNKVSMPMIIFISTISRQRRIARRLSSISII